MHDQTAVTHRPDPLRIWQGEYVVQITADDGAPEGVALQRMEPPVGLGDIPVADRAEHVGVRRLGGGEPARQCQQQDEADQHCPTEGA
jgi:hypothetical protein